MQPPVAEFDRDTYLSTQGPAAACALLCDHSLRLPTRADRAEKAHIAFASATTILPARHLILRWAFAAGSDVAGGAGANLSE